MPLMPAVELVITIAPPLPRSIIDGTAISTVLNTPVRFTSMTSCQASCFSCKDIGAMPALASTMSTGPSSATPASNAARRPPSSRTSACRATIRRPSASTSLTVWSRSWGVAIGYGTVSIWRQMSTAMMSAPSWASRTAWLRPWPRAAPVMKATLPSSLPATDSLLAERILFMPGTGSRRLPALPRESGQRVLVAGVRGWRLRTAADRDRHRLGPAAHAATVRVVQRRAGRGRRVGSRQGLGTVSLHAFRVGPVQRQAGEELGGHAAAAARVEGLARCARSPGLRPAQLGEKLRVAPHRGEPAGLPHVPGQELLMDCERARVNVAHRVDQADHTAGPAEVQAGQRPAVRRQVEERVAGQHLLAMRDQPVVELTLLRRGLVELVPGVGAPAGRPQPGQPQLRAVAVGELLELVELGDVVPGDHDRDLEALEPGRPQVLHRPHRGGERAGPAHRVVHLGGRAVQRDLHVHVVARGEPA